jgi:hypothetical protein
MLPEPDDEKICSVRAKKGNDAINFLGFDQMARYLNRVPAPLGDGGLHEFLVISPAIRFDALRRIWSNGDD